MTSSYPLPSIAAGFDTGVTWPTASEYFKYVSIDATTTRASTVMRSMPTSETRTHASMTIPLSSTRSRTSMRLDPPDALSTGMSPLRTAPRRAAPGRDGAGQGGELSLEHPDLLAQGLVLRLVAVATWREVVVVFPPVETNLLRLVDRADDEADADGEELDLGERHLDVAGDDEALVEDAIEDIDEAACLMSPYLQLGCHGGVRL